MRVEHLPCGPFANRSEELAYRAVEAHFRATVGEGTVYVLTNLAHALKPDGQPDEIDLVVIGPGGATAIEVKHWDIGRLKGRAREFEHHADLITTKAKRVATRLRRLYPELSYVAAGMLLTTGPKNDSSRWTTALCPRGQAIRSGGPRRGVCGHPYESCDH
ncbi:nuclease-related domain-containing protein [Sphingomonas sp. Ant H11]|uniref:nuclease-related domain-containing protein n=1 Tax=Sphingomonas sp. Ant H11 TaxID=1564113 RepID=UPI0009DD1046